MTYLDFIDHLIAKGECFSCGTPHPDPLDDSAFVRCYECFHTWPSEGMLRVHDEVLRVAFGWAPRPLSEPVLVCPCCAHDL